MCSDRRTESQEAREREREREREKMRFIVDRVINGVF